MAITISLIDATGTGAGVAPFVGTDFDLIKIDAGAGLQTITAYNTANPTKAASILGGEINIPGYGRISLAGSKAATFIAEAAFTGAATLINGTAGSTILFTKADFTSATAPVSLAGTGAATIAEIIGSVGADTFVGGAATTKISGGAGNDVLSGAVVTVFDGGDGDDTITTTVAANVTGGAGADKFIQTDAALKMTVTDYNFGQSDAVTLKGAYAGATITLANTGVFDSDATAGLSTITVKDVAANGAYKIKVTDTGAGAETKEFWTTKAGASAVTLDGSGSTTKLVIDASTAAKAVVAGSSKNDAIKLGANATLVAGVNGGTDAVTGFVTGFAGDVLNLTGVTLSDVKFGATAGAGATIGSTTTITGTGFGTATEDKILVQENGGTVKKVAFAADAGQKITYSDADVYMATGLAAAAGQTTLDASGVVVDGTVINLLDTAKYKGISAITGAGAATGAYIGLGDSLAGGTKINLVAGTKASEVWGGSKAIDKVTLKGANGVQDVMWFGTTDGLDEVTGFKAGFVATSDVVNLYDVTDVSKLTFAVGAAATDVKITAATGSALNVTAVDAFGVANSVQLQLKNAAGTVKKVATAVDSTAASNINGVGADMVIGHTGAADTVSYGSTQTANVVVNLLDTAVYKSIENVDLTGATGSYNVVIGSGLSASNITLAGATAEVWGGSSLVDAITAGAGVDTVWFGNNDGADAVTGFTVGTDKVKFYDKAVANLNAAYTWNGTKFASTTKSADSLDLGALVDNKTINVLDKDNKEAKVALGNTTLTYTKDTKVYMGSTAVAANTINATGSENLVLYLGNGIDATVNDIYFSGITAINAGTATGQTVLIGSAAGADVLTGGTTSSAIWGGGLAADDMKGNSTAVDQFWFGAGDGTDKVSAGVDKKDTIVLHNIASIADVTMTVDAVGNNFVIAAKDGSTLTVTDTGAAALDAGLTFQFGINASAKNYTYDRIAKNFVAK